MVTAHLPAPVETSPLPDVRSLVSGRLEAVDAAISRLDHRLAGTRGGREELRQRLSGLETVWGQMLQQLSRVNPDDIDRTFRALAATRADLAATEERCRDLSARLDDLHREAELLRSVHLSLGDLSAQQGSSAAEGSDRLRSASRQVFQIIEEERMRIARDMHDGPAQSMANLVLQAEILEHLIARDPQQIREELSDFKQGVRTVLEETRRLIFDLRPMTLDDLGLMPTLRKFVREFGEKCGVNARLLVVGEEMRPPAAYENTLFRIIQEALNNSRKHARARNVEVTVSFESHRVSALVQDDGIGFDVDATESRLEGSRNLGLISMHERAELEKGTLEVQSQPGKGTTVAVSFRY